MIKPEKLMMEYLLPIFMIEVFVLFQVIIILSLLGQI